MNSKGQIFSLDFILAFVLIVLALILSVNFFESTALNAQEQSNRSELLLAAKSAMDTLTNKPSLICELRAQDNTVLDYLPSCVPEQLKIYKKELAIPDDVDCEISQISGSRTVAFGPNDCSSDPTGKLNVVSVDRRMVALGRGTNTRIDKFELLDCQKDLIPDNCELEEVGIRLKVWKT